MQATNENKERATGVLLHISSLPNEYGIGSFGKSAYDFVDFLSKSKIKYWQVMPLVQTGFGDSPYQSVSSQSGNPYFIDLEELKKEGLLTQEELNQVKTPCDIVDYAKLYETRYPILRKAYRRFNCDQEEFYAFLRETNLQSYALFMTIKTYHKGACFYEWEEPLRYKDKKAVEEYLDDKEDEYYFWLFLQYEFFKQWKKLKEYANEKGIKIIGDIPLYVAYDSVDVWENPKQFLLDKDLKMTKVAGVPPDYFCALGQLWGNPLYDWEKMKETKYAWWINRIKTSLQTYDIVRIDHFRGLDRYYTIPANAENAIVGKWEEGPKNKLFLSARKQLGELSVIAEDLGIIDDGVRKLVKTTGFPNMRVLLFAFEGGDNNHLPKHHIENSVCYTGTHDNDTVVGYIKRLTEEQRIIVKENMKKAMKLLGIHSRISSEEEMAQAFITMALASKSYLSIIPIQDILQLDNSARMNTPGTNQTNWKFRLSTIPQEEIAISLKKQIKKYHRD